MKSDMENIWLEYREPEAYKDITDKINEQIQIKGCAIDEFIKPISNILVDAGYQFTISKRTKTPYSIWRKMQVKEITFDQIYDLYAVRIVFEAKPDQSERKQCWDIYSLISEDHISKIDRLRDWVSTPKSNGYEALHCTLMSPQGNWVEVQIRSIRMDEIAEKGVAAHWSYKGVTKNQNENDMDNWLNMVREVLNNPDVNALEFLDKFHEGLLASEIYIFTPKGESKSLSKGSTALDFAYSIHTAIGNKAIAAKVNLKLVPLSHVLKNGDQVEIITAESQKPQRDWLKFVTTQKAKNLIYEGLKADIKDAIKEGQTILEENLAKYGIKPQLRVLKKLLLAYNISNKEELYTKISAGIVDLSDLEDVLKKNTENKFVKYWNLQFFANDKHRHQHPDTNLDYENIKRPDIDKKKDYLLEENPVDKSLSYLVADCCKPIPGDAVIGFVDENNNVIVHKKTCRKAISMAARDGNNIVNAKWTKHTILSFLVKLEIRGIDRIGIVNEITQYITLVSNVNIRKINFETHDGIFEGFIELYVHNTEDLETMIQKLQNIKGLESVIRVNLKES